MSNFLNTRTTLSLDKYQSEQLIRLFPNVVKDGQINIDLLLEELINRNCIVDRKYELTWKGKHFAKLECAKLCNKKFMYAAGDGVNEEKTKNLYIEGDNIDALKLLRKDYLNSIKLIYIDPPYNTGNDFIYNDKFNCNMDLAATFNQDSIKTGDNSRASDTHTNWLNMIYPRLKLAKDLLSDDGVIFISIDDNEQANLKLICDEIFGENNFVNCIAVKMSEATGVKMNHQNYRFPKIKEYILFYKKNSFTKFECIDKYKQQIWDKENNIFLENMTEEIREQLAKIKSKENIDINDVNKANLLLSQIKKVPLSQKIKQLQLKNNELSDWLFENAYRIIKTVGSISLTKVVKSLNDIPKQEIASSISNDGVLFFYITDYNKQTSQPRLRVIFADENIYKNPCDFWQDIKTSGAIADEGGIKYKNGKKPLKLLKRIIKMTTKNDDIILDFFSGSASTAHACLEVNLEEGGNRHFIMVQIPENLDETFLNASGENKNDLKNIIDFLDSIGKKHVLSELGKERLRLTSKKIEKQKANFDTGFRVYKITEKYPFVNY